MLEALFVLGRELGCEEAWVGTEHDNTPARRLYASFGAEAEPVVMYEYELCDSTARERPRDRDAALTPPAPAAAGPSRRRRAAAPGAA
jgi:hypothetical protein